MGVEKKVITTSGGLFIKHVVAEFELLLNAV